MHYGKHGKHHELKVVNFVGKTKEERADMKTHGVDFLGKPTREEIHNARLRSEGFDSKNRKHVVKEHKQLKPGTFVSDQYEEGVEQKLKGVSELSLWSLHKSK